MIAARPVLNSRHFGIITAAFTLFILYGSFVPLATRSLSWDDAIDRYSRAMSRGVRLESKSDFAANVILFIPLGFLAAGSVSVDRRSPIAVLILVPAMGALSAAIEFGQLWFPDRNTNINDVAAETLGGAAGVAIWWVFGQDITDRLRAAWERLGPGDWAVKLLPAYVFFLVIVHGMPFDLTLSPWQIKKKYDAGLEIDAAASGAPTIAIAPYPRQIFEKTLLNIAYFVPVGALLAQLPGRRWRSRENTGRVLAIGLAIAAGIEAVQLIVLSAGTYASDVLCGGLFVLAGWRLTIQTRPLPRRAWTLAAIIWASSLVLCYWAPYDLEPDRFQSRLAQGEWMPFADYFAGNYIAAFNRIFNKTVVYIPLGFAFARARHSDPHQPIASCVLQALTLGGFLSATIELGQPLFNDHRASTSDVILGAMGACFGAILASRAARIATTDPRTATSSEFFFYDGVR